MPGKSVLHTIKGCAMGCSGGGVVIVDGMNLELSLGSRLKINALGSGLRSARKLWSGKNGGSSACCVEII